jgi:hypothetical protein
MEVEVKEVEEVEEVKEVKETRLETAVIRGRMTLHAADCLL